MHTNTRDVKRFFYRFLLHSIGHEAMHGGCLCCCLGYTHTHTYTHTWHVKGFSIVLDVYIDIHKRSATAIVADELCLLLIKTVYMC